MRKTKIVCTIGPASSDPAVFADMCRAGMNVARLNFSHGTHAEHQAKIDMIKQVREELGLPIAIMLDTKGPEYRIGTFADGKIELHSGDTFTFTTEPVTGNAERVSVSYAGLAQDLEPGDTVLDMGTGSGILAIAAAMLGAEVRTVVDIDENCLRTAQENAEKNHVSIGRGLCGDALRDEKLAADIGSGYSVIVANIVADVIIGMAPMFFAKTAEGGTLICSGILNERADEVRAALEKAGFEVVNHAKSDDWSAFTAKK